MSPPGEGAAFGVREAMGGMGFWRRQDELSGRATSGRGRFGRKKGLFREKISGREFFGEKKMPGHQKARRSELGRSDDERLEDGRGSKDDGTALIFRSAFAFRQRLFLAPTFAGWSIIVSPFAIAALRFFVDRCFVFAADTRVPSLVFSRGLRSFCL